MQISTLKELSPETRVAITPIAVSHYVKLGLAVVIEQGAGQAAGFSDGAYIAAGARIEAHRSTLLKSTQIVLCVNEPSLKDLKGLQAGALLVGSINKQPDDFIGACREAMISVFSMNYIPRLSRAQSLDSLSSQANLAGYRGVLEAVAHYHRAVPMMMTAAGMIHPARALILGAGVAGLQAIATAKRLGADVTAFDVRAAAKEQVESLGAKFIEVPADEHTETTGGYAREMSDAYKQRQAALLSEQARLADLIICTALIPDKPAPILLDIDTVEHMKAGSVIVDLATARGGNCELSQRDKIIQHQGVTLIGYSHMERLIPTTASELYANNLLQVIRLLYTESTGLQYDLSDEIIQQALLCHQS